MEKRNEVKGAAKGTKADAKSTKGAAGKIVDNIKKVNAKIKAEVAAIKSTEKKVVDPNDLVKADKDFAAKQKEKRDDAQAQVTKKAEENKAAEVSKPAVKAESKLEKTEAPATKANSKAGKVEGIGIFQPATVRIKVDGKTIHIGLKACKCSLCGINEPPCWHVDYVFKHKADFEKIGAAFHAGSVAETKKVVTKEEEQKAAASAAAKLERDRQREIEAAKAAKEKKSEPAAEMKGDKPAPKAAVKAGKPEPKAAAKIETPVIDSLGFAKDQLISVSHIDRAAGKTHDFKGYVTKEVGNMVYLRKPKTEENKFDLVIKLKDVVEAVLVQ